MEYTRSFIDSIITALGEMREYARGIDAEDHAELVKIDTQVWDMKEQYECN